MLELKKQQTGISALEIVIVIGILGVILNIVIGSFSSFRNSSILQVGTEDIVSLMMQSRSDALSSKDDSVYGIHFETNNVVTFKGGVYSPSDPDNHVVSLDSRIQVSNIVLNGGGSDVVFNRLTGKTNQFGTIKITAVSASETFKTITVYSTGLVDVN
jgi:Tfp pilus assembly protein FimT